MQNVQTTYTNFFIFALLVATMIALGFVFSEYTQSSEIISELRLENDVQKEVNDNLVITVNNQNQVITELEDALNISQEQLRNKSEEANVAQEVIRQMEMELTIESISTDENGNEVIGYKYSPAESVKP